MDKLIDARFQGVEAALAKLTHSIATYNPSPSLATELVKADADLSKGLEQLSSHQANYQKIISLRSTSSALDTQIKETLTILTDTRRALIETSSTTLPETTNPVSYAELLSYARRISKFTLPVTYREPGTTTPEAEGTAEQEDITPKESKSEPQTNGNTTPEVPATNGDSQMIGMGAVLEAFPALPAQTQNTTALPVDFARYLNPSAEVPFIPWPSQDYIRAGALANIQRIEDDGNDPTNPMTWDAKTGEEAAEAKRKADEEEVERKKEEEIKASELANEQRRAQVEEARRHQVEGRANAGLTAGERPPQEAKFSLAAFDDDDDD